LETDFERKYHSLERTHWWFVSRRELIYRMIRQYDKNIKILEIGCSSGPLIEILNEAGYENVYGLDVSKEAIQLCRSKGMTKVVQMEGAELGFKENVFDLIIASDVLEHIHDDSQAILEWKRVLKKKGDIIAFVPAFKFLWSGHDVVNRHFRRYNKREFKELFEKNECNIVRISFWNFLLFLPVLIHRRIEKKKAKSAKPKDDLFEFSHKANIFFSLILKMENMYCRFFNLPVGLSLFVIAKK
jgi:ubiquinone/menaquinone biosynthesis C-methylase UbiE